MYSNPCSPTIILSVSEMKLLPIQPSNDEALKANFRKKVAQNKVTLNQFITKLVKNNIQEVHMIIK